MAERRRGKVVDRAVQMTLATRIVWHWFLFLVVAALAVPMFRVLFVADLNVPLSQLAANAGIDALALVVVFLALLPCFLVDTIKLSHRFCGPMRRLHNAIRSLARGQKPDAIHLRKGDFWHEVTDDFNVALSREWNEGEPTEAAQTHQPEDGDEWSRTVETRSSGA